MKQKVLLVDDGKDSLPPSLHHSLSSETYAVVVAENVPHAIAKSQAGEIMPVSNVTAAGPLDEIKGIS